MSYDLAVWEGERPASDAAAAATYETITAELESGEPKPPSDTIAAFVAALVARWPDITADDGEDSPWASGPLIGEASGSWIHFPIVWDRADEASAYAARLAGELGLVCFDPQTETVLSSGASPGTHLRRGWFGLRRRR